MIWWQLLIKPSYDVTDKTTTNIISRVGYDGASYTHQGWVTDKNWQTTLILVSKPASSTSSIITSDLRHWIL